MATPGPDDNLVIELLGAEMMSASRRRLIELRQARFLGNMVAGFASAGMPEVAARITDLNEGWKPWTSYEEDCAEISGRWINVRHVDTGELIMRGKLSPHTDLVGGAALLEPDAERGFDYVRRAILLPRDPEAFRKQLSAYLFRVEGPALAEV